MTFFSIMKVPIVLTIFSHKRPFFSFNLNSKSVSCMRALSNPMPYMRVCYKTAGQSITMVFHPEYPRWHCASHFILYLTVCTTLPKVVIGSIWVYAMIKSRRKENAEAREWWLQQNLQRWVMHIYKSFKLRFCYGSHPHPKRINVMTHFFFLQHFTKLCIF